MSFGGSAQSAKTTTENNLRLLRKSSFKGHKFMNSGKFEFSYNNNNLSLEDIKDTHANRAKREALLITIFGIIPFAILFLYWLGAF